MAAVEKKPFYRHLYFWVLLGIYLGGMAGYFFRGYTHIYQPLSEGFISLIKMLIGPIIFCTIVLGITTAGDMKKIGRVGWKTLVYFEVTSTLALIIGLLVGNFVKPGDDINADPVALSKGAETVAKYEQAAHDQTVAGFLLHIIPKTFSDAFTGSGDMLQVLLVSLLFGFALNRLGAKGRAVHEFIEQASHIFFSMMNIIMKLAPVGAGAAMAFAIGKYGLDILGSLLLFMGVFYATCIAFVVFVLGPLAMYAGFSLWKFLRYIKEEIFIVLGTSSSETVIAPLMEKLVKMGCRRETVGLVVPSGYSFNLDGTNIYLTMAILFMAQAMNIELTLWQQLTLLLVAMLTSKGAAGVTGSGFITLAATLAVVPQAGIPVAALALILGIDRFMSEARSITNLIGNGVAGVVMSKWENEIDRKELDKALGS